MVNFHNLLQETHTTDTDTEIHVFLLITQTLFLHRNITQSMQNTMYIYIVRLLSLVKKSHCYVGRKC